MTTVRQGIHHIAIRARDFDASVRLYTEGLGLARGLAWGEGDGRGLMLVTADGGAVELFAGGTDADEPEGHFLHLAFTSADPDADYARALAAGATPMRPPYDHVIPTTPTPTPVRLAFVYGLDGEVLEFFHVK